MGKRRRTWNEERYFLDLKNGVSQGTGAGYIPGISVHDFPSRGVVARIPGRKTGRIHHLLSHWEEYYFYCYQIGVPGVLSPYSLHQAPEAVEI